MAITTLQSLIEAGVQYGTKASLWHPKMKPFIFGKQNGIHIIDLTETAKQLVHAHAFIKGLAKANKTILFVGTKRQAKGTIKAIATEIGQPYVAERWLGGTLTNIETIRSSIRRLDDIEAELAKPGFERQAKKLQARYARQRKRILRNLEGVRNLNRVPDALVVIDPKKEATAVAEARRLNIPVIALIDTDSDPDTVNLPIPGNDDGMRSIQAILQIIAAAINEGRSELVTKESTAPAVAEAPASAEA